VAALRRNRSRWTGFETVLLSVDKLTTFGCPMLLGILRACTGRQAKPKPATKAQSSPDRILITVGVDGFPSTLHLSYSGGVDLVLGTDYYVGHNSNNNENTTNFCYNSIIEEIFAMSRTALIFLYVFFMGRWA
jgi:hypothetical protein